MIYSTRRSMGFTLIELMIVILIIAILIGVAVPVYLACNINAKTRTCQANLRTIDGAINTYFADALEYPDTVGHMASGDYRVLKDTYECPTCISPYTLMHGAAKERPSVSCPGGEPGHII